MAGVGMFIIGCAIAILWTRFQVLYYHAGGGKYGVEAIRTQLE